MLRKFIIAAAALGAFGNAMVFGTAGPIDTAFASAATPLVTDFSAQPPPRRGPPAKGGGAAPRVAPVAPRTAPRVVPVAPRVVNPQFAPRVVPGVVAPRIVGPRFVPRVSPGARGASFIGGRQIFVNRGAYTPAAAGVS